MNPARDAHDFLGLGPETPPDEAEATYRELAAFLSLEAVPRPLRHWAARQRALADEAYLALGVEGETDAAAAPTAAEGSETARPEPEFDPDFLDELPPLDSPRPAGKAEQSPEAGRRWIVTEERHPARSLASSPGARSDKKQRKRPGPGSESPLAGSGRSTVQAWQRVLLGVVLGLAILGVVYVAAEGLPGTGVARSTGSAGVGGAQVRTELDPARVAELKARLDQDPNDKAALTELGESHMQAGRWQDTVDWFTRLLAVDPNDLHARTDLGTASYNLGRLEQAREAWQEVARRDPSDPQIHYNLGYLYANGVPRDVEAAKREWELVLQLAPGSELARTAQGHLAGLR